MNKIDEHPKVIAYKKEMIEQGRCRQCVSIRCKGICSCKNGKRLEPTATEKYVDIMQFMNQLRREGWEWR